MDTNTPDGQGTPFFGDFLKSSRQRKHLTQQRLAGLIGVNRDSIGSWERGEFFPETPTMLHEIARVLDLREDEKRLLFEALYGTASMLPLYNLPEHNPYFTGREAILAQLHGQLTAGKSVELIQTQAISGLGGIGKTQIAIEYAYRFREHYHDILWVVADSRETLMTSCLTLARHLRLPEQEEREQHKVVEAVKRWLREHKRWLLILDDIEDLDLVREFVPAPRQGAVVLTTRRGETRPVAEALLLEDLPEGEALLFLLRRAGSIPKEAPLETASASDRAAALTLVQTVGGLPLALDQAGAYIAETKCSFSDYLDLFKKRQKDLLSRRGTLASDHPQSVVTTFSLAFEQVQQHNMAALDLLKFCAFLAPDAIPLEVIKEGVTHLGTILGPVANDTLQLDHALETLQSYSLVRRDGPSSTLYIHRLVQTILQGTMDKQTEQIWLECAIRAMSTAFSFGDMAVERWKQYERLLPHALLLLSKGEHVDHQLEEADILLTNTATYLMNRAQYNEAELLYRRALQASRRRLGSEHPGVASRLNNLAALYAYQGKHEKAEPLFQQTLQIYERMLGPEHLEVAHSRSNLANLYRTMGRYKEAEPLFQQALPILEQYLGTNHVEVATCLSNWAILAKSLGNYEEAERLYKRTLQIQEETLGSEHPEVARNLDNLAVLFTDQGRYEEAKLLHEQALQLREHILGPAHPEVGLSLNNLGMLYSKQAKYREARQLCERALRVYEQSLAPEHPDVVQCMNNLAALCAELGEDEKAESLFRQSLQICEQTFGPEHPAMANYLENLAIFYARRRRYEEAEPLYLQALQIGQQALGPEHPRLAEYMNNLAALYADLGKYGEAEPLYQHALQINMQALGSEHPNVADNLNNLGNLYVKQSKDSEAESCYQQAWLIYERALGPDDPHIAYALSNLAFLYAKQGKYERAEPLFRRALHLREQAQEPQNLETAQIMHNLAQLREAQGNSEEARDWYTRALTIRQRALGAQHPKTLETRARLINLLRALGQHEEAGRLEVNQTQGTNGEEQVTLPKA